METIHATQYVLGMVVIVCALGSIATNYLVFNKQHPRYWLWQLFTILWIIQFILKG